jgi:hypothetical protein
LLNFIQIAQKQSLSIKLRIPKSSFIGDPPEESVLIETSGSANDMKDVSDLRLLCAVASLREKNIYAAA